MLARRCGLWDKAPPSAAPKPCLYIQSRRPIVNVIILDLMNPFEYSVHTLLHPVHCCLSLMTARQNESLDV